MIIVLLMFLILTIGGLFILRSTTDEKRFFTLLPASMILGACTYIFLLNWNSKVLHGQIEIILSTIEFIFISLFLYVKYKKQWIKLDSSNSLIRFLCISLVLVIISLSAYKMINQLPAADVSMQWAYAATFARGNYPIKVPWQPDLNPNYHLGAYFLEGALYSLSGLPILTIHTLMNIYLLVSGSLLSIFLFWEYRYTFRNIWFIVASLTLFISFGVIILVYPNILEQQSMGRIIDFSQLLAAIPAKGTAGAALVDLNILSYLPARSLSIGLSLLALYFAYAPFKSTKMKIALFSLLVATIALVEESMFLPLFLTIGASLMLSLCSFIPNIKYLKQQRKNLVMIILLSSVLVILQGGFVSENLFSNKEPVYRFTLPPNDISFLGKFNVLNNVTFNTPFPFLAWLVPSPVILILFLLLYAFIKKNPQVGLVGIFSTLAFIAYLSVEYKYCGSCTIRIHSFGYIAAGYGFILLLFYIFKDLSLRKNILGLFILTPILILPTLIPDLKAQVLKINEGIRDGVKGIIFAEAPQSPMYRIIDWANQELPLNSRVLVIDNGLPSPAGSLNFQYRGLYTILGPLYIHVNRQEPGPEYFDLMLTLNPSIFKQTNTEYVYIDSESMVYRQLPQFRKDDLANNNYFQILRSTDSRNSVNGNESFQRLYKVIPIYLDKELGGKEIKEGTLQTLQMLIPNDKSVYVADYGDPPKMSFWYRMAVVLALKDKDLRFNFSQTDYQLIETIIPHNRGTLEGEYNFYVLGPDKVPPFPAKLVWSNLYTTAWKRD